MSLCHVLKPFLHNGILKFGSNVYSNAMNWCLYVPIMNTVMLSFSYHPKYWFLDSHMASYFSANKNNFALLGHATGQKHKHKHKYGSYLTFKFQVGESTQACTNVTIMDDDDLEGNHTFEVILDKNRVLGGGTGGLGSPTSTTITIQDPEGILQCMVQDVEMIYINTLAYSHSKSS